MRLGLLGCCEVLVWFALGRVDVCCIFEVENIVL